MYQQGMQDYGGQPKLCLINMVLQPMTDRIGIIACGDWQESAKP
jgi:hypothetical protein